MTPQNILIEARTKAATAALQTLTLQRLNAQYAELEIKITKTIILDVDDTRLDTIVRYRTLREIVTARISQAEQDFVLANEQLEAECRRFATDYLSPRLTNQLNNAREVVASELKNLLLKDPDIASRTESSVMVGEVKSLMKAVEDALTSRDSNYPLSLANELLNISGKSDELEEVGHRFSDGAIWNKLLSPALKG